MLFLGFSHIAAALPEQRDMTWNCPSHRWGASEESRGTHRQRKALIDEQRAAVVGAVGELRTGSDGAGQARCQLSLNNTPLTTFHRSLTRESTLRMSACSAPPLIPSADQGRCPHCFLPPTSTNSLRLGQAFGPRWRTLQKPKRHKTVRSWGINMKEISCFY